MQCGSFSVSLFFLYRSCKFYIFAACLEQLVRHALWCSCQSCQSHCTWYYLVVADTGLVVVVGPSLFFK